jgi:hypothetical protein
MLWQVALTYLCVLVGAVIFRASTLGAALSLLSGMVGLHGLTIDLPTDLFGLFHAGAAVVWLAALYAIVWIAPNTQQIMERSERTRIAWQPTLPWAVALGCGATLGLLSMGGTGEFVYFKF